MGFGIKPTHLCDVVVVVPTFFRDDRGFFVETYREDHFRQLGLTSTFVQDNHSGSTKGVIRGLHFQWDPPMGKLMRVTRGTAFLAAVDIRKDSPTLGQWVGINASAEDGTQVWAPAGFARGYCAISDYVEVQYKCTGVYNSKCESAIRWNDPDIGVQWPIVNGQLSNKDRTAQTLEQWLVTPESDNFRYSENVSVVGR
jgi:dTDP-4-dehydrorhamnose 3,5-epimerase